MGRFFDTAIAEQCAQASTILDADIAFRAETIATRGIAAMLTTLNGDLGGDGRMLNLPRPFHVVVDWADDGVLLIPCTAQTGPMLFAAERPQIPILVYGARGTAALESSSQRLDRDTD